MLYEVITASANKTFLNKTTMRLYNRINAIKRINQLAGKGIPFVFLINFEHNCSYIEETNAIDANELLYQFGTKTNYRHTNTTVKSHPIVWSPTPMPFEDRITSYNVCYTKLLRIPTAVKRLSVDAGYGPPCVMDGQTSTPVGTPL